MKKSIFLVAAVVFLAAGFISSCGDDVKDKDTIVVLKNVKFNSSALNLSLGDEDLIFTVALTYTLVPEKATNIESISWSSNATGIATVSQSGLVTSLDLGEAIITVTVKTSDGNTFSDKCTVNVVPKPIGVENVEFEKEGQVLAPGSSVKLQPIITPEDAANKSLIWVSNKEKIASVNQEGVVTAADTIGVAVITVTTVEGGFKARYNIDVRVVVTSVKLTESGKIVCEVGAEKELEANVLPANATNQNVAWTSSNTSVATVDSKGKVSARGVGTAIITVTTEEGDFEDTREIEVLTTSVTGVKFDDNAKLELKVADEVTLKANVLPNTATNQKVTWESSNTSVATVDDNGKVSAKDVGTTFITVTTDDGSFQDKREIEVSRIAVTGVYLGNDITGSAVRMVYEGINNVFNLTANIVPSDATIKSVTWESSDKNVAVVDESGKLTFKGPGSVTITATTTEGGFSSSLALNINNYYSWLDRSEWSFPGYNVDSQDAQTGYSSQATNEGGDPNGRVVAMLDGNDGTFWHARWGSPSADYPHWFIVDLGEETDFSAVMMRRRTDNGGSARGYMVFSSNVMTSPLNNNNWKDSWTDRGEYSFDPGSNNKQVKDLDDGVINARYILIYFDAKFRGSGQYVMLSEFGLFKKE